jgi:triphosphatase
MCRRLPELRHATEASIALEIELKLTAQPADLPKLKGTLAAMGSRPEGSPTAFVTTYYDTPDLTLRRQGLVLRVREGDGRFVQTVKTIDGGDILTRGEWEDELADNRPDLTAAASGPRLPPGIGNSLRPLFATRVARTRIAIEPSPETQIEAAIDEGEIDGGERVEAIGEIELELKRGAAAALFEVALRLCATAPLAIETRSKAERGYRLIDGAAAITAVRAEPLRLDPALGLDEALQRIGRACLAHYLRNQPAALVGDAEGVHQMRVALRRLRSALVVFGKMLPAADRRFLSGELKRLDDTLAPMRNLDVLLSELLPPVRTAPAGASDLLDPLAAAIARARRAADDRLTEQLRSPRYGAAMLRLLHWFERRPRSGAAPAVETTVGELLPSLLDRRFRAVKRRGKHFRRQTPKERHRLRIAVKKLRYTIELFGGSPAREDGKAFVRELRRLQDGLGYANDVHAARDMLRRICAGAGPESRLAGAGSRLLDWHEQALAKRERELRQGLRRLKHSARFWRDADFAAVVRRDTVPGNR